MNALCQASRREAQARHLLNLNHASLSTTQDGRLFSRQVDSDTLVAVMGNKLPLGTAADKNPRQAFTLNDVIHLSLLNTQENNRFKNGPNIQRRR